MDLERMPEQQTTEVNGEGRSMVRSTLGSRMTEVESIQVELFTLGDRCYNRLYVLLVVVLAHVSNMFDIQGFLVRVLRIFVQ